MVLAQGPPVPACTATPGDPDPFGGFVLAIDLATERPVRRGLRVGAPALKVDLPEPPDVIDHDFDVDRFTRRIHGDYGPLFIDPTPTRAGLRRRGVWQPANGLRGQAASCAPGDVRSRGPHQRQEAMQPELQASDVRAEDVGAGESQQSSSHHRTPDEADPGPQDLGGLKGKPAPPKCDLPNHPQLDGIDE